MAKQECYLLQKDLIVGNSNSNGIWEIDTNVGLKVESISNDNNILLAFVLHQTNPQLRQTSKICWLDPDCDLCNNETQSVNIKREYLLKVQDTTPVYDDGTKTTIDTSRPRILSLLFVHSCDPNEAMSMVVTLRNEGQIESQVIQAQIQYNEEDSKVQLGPIHMVYRIPLPIEIQGISACPIDPHHNGPYSFRFKASHGWNQPEDMYEFKTASKNGDYDSRHDGSSIGTIRLLTMKQEFELARATVHQVGMEALLQDKYARFHPAEIAFKRMKLVLDELSPETEDVWNECLASLKRATGSEQGQGVVLEAANYVIKWPVQSDNLSTECTPTIGQMVTGLTTFLETMKELSDDFLDEFVSSSITATYKEKVISLGEKLDTIQYLGTLVDSDPSISKTAKLHPQFASLGSINALFSKFVQSGNFRAAEELCGSALRSKLSPDEMVAAIVQIPSTVPPQKYVNLVKETVLPRLSINHELLPPILTWSCRMADEFDEAQGTGIDQSIFLLDTIEKATRELQLKIHSSFAHYSPFVERVSTSTKGRLFPLKEIRSKNDVSMRSTSINTSFASDTSFCKENDTSANEKSSTLSDDFMRPIPTILEIGNMKKGAQKAKKIGSIPSLRSSNIEENEQSVEAKLEASRWLKTARSLGLRRNLVSLHDFVYCGGAKFISKELIRVFSSRADSHEVRYRALRNELRSFCEDSGVEYDKALLDYTKELCSGNSTSPEAIEEAVSVARCCQSPTYKCQITLITLRAALFCRFSPIWLTDLSKDAIEWSAGDSSIRSELEEASRLLLIDGIVGRYCGNGAKELFHVDNPIHATRLLNFVSTHLDNDSVLPDVLDLCEAFHHLSTEDGCGRLIQNAIVKGRHEKAESFLRSLYDCNKLSAHNVFSRVLSFSIDFIGDVSRELGMFPSDESDNRVNIRKKEVTDVTSSARELTKIALVHARTMVASHFGSGFTTAHYDVPRLESLIDDFERLALLQKDHGIFLPLSDLNRPEVVVKVASELVSRLAALYETGGLSTANTMATRTKRACSLLSGTGVSATGMSEEQVLFAGAANSVCQLARKTNKSETLDFMKDLGILEASKSNLASRCCLAVALNYCFRASKTVNSQDLISNMKGIVTAYSLLQDYTLSNCPGEFLGAVTTFSGLCDIVSQVLTRADEGIGEELEEFRRGLLDRATETRWSFSSSESHKQCDIDHLPRIGTPAFHPTWYVGDGLLLPPREALTRGLEYCKQVMGIQLMDEPSMGIESFVSNRGAQSLALRILSHSIMTQACLRQAETSFEFLEEFNEDIAIALVERYLGGTGNGITSGVVDSQLAVSHLLSLPLKLAFKIYRSSLPTAISTRDFTRVVTLATIGKVAGSNDSILSPTGTKLSSWTRQSKFVKQCDNLATKASWWNVLAAHNVQFDPHRFDDEENANTKQESQSSTNTDNSYIGSMIPELISSMSTKEGELDQILQSATQFATDFSLPLELPIQYYIEYLLSPTVGELETGDIRSKVSSLDAMGSHLLRRLDSRLKRVNILRNCLVRFEKDAKCTDYEKLSVILSLYQIELSSLLSRDSKLQNSLVDRLHLEMDLVDRRRDALAILSSYFQGDKKPERPPFSDFFLPFPASGVTSAITASQTTISCNILGWESSSTTEEAHFDPLKPLEKTLRSSCSPAVTSALSPLCLPLGVPRGYIKVRSLISKFQESKREGAALPTYEDDVLPILNQLRSHSDVADLAEWCSMQYGLEHPDKLKCLDHALTSAIQASNEAERCTDTAEGDQSIALTRVKRITAAKDLLADRLDISEILRDARSQSQNRTSFDHIICKLTDRLEQKVWSTAQVFIPERFVDTLFEEASNLAAESALGEKQCISIGQFRQFSQLIHKVCNCVAGKYSHVQIGYLARRLTRRWMFYGDTEANSKKTEESDNDALPTVMNSRLIPDIDEEDTMNFQMDLSILKEDTTWSSGASNRNTETRRLTSEEEPSSLNASSAREKSEISSQRTSLRIAFVMAFADSYHRPLSNNSEKSPDENDENSSNNKFSAKKPKRRGLLSQMKLKKTKEQQNQHEFVLEHCRELLRIVLAKSSSVDRVMKGLNASVDTIGVDGPGRKSPRHLLLLCGIVASELPLS